MLTCDVVEDKYTKPYWVPDGWNVDKNGEAIRQMRLIKSRWQLNKCGTLEKDRVEQCKGCKHA